MLRYASWLSLFLFLMGASVQEYLEEKLLHIGQPLILSFGPLYKWGNKGAGKGGGHTAGR